MKNTSLKENLMRLLILSLFISLIISSIALIVEKTPSKLSKIPTENFVSLRITKSIVIEDCEYNHEECEDSLFMEGSTASGMVFGTNEKGESLILTAGHFCETIFGIPEGSISPTLSLMFETETILTVTDFYGAVWDAEIVDFDRSNDLCLVRSEMPSFRKLELSENMPDVGEEIYTISAPLSIRSDGAAPHFAGMFSGCDYSGICFFGIPAIFGSSGSLVLNSDYEIIGMIQMADPNFPVVGMGVGVEEIRDFLDKNKVIY